MSHFYEDVPGLGNVAISRHAQEKMEHHGITEAVLEDVLWGGRDRPDGNSTWREKAGVRLVIVRPEPFRGAMLVVTAFRVMPQARVR